MRIIKQHRTHRGDTIVEVLLAVAITAAVLAGAYVTTNRSFRVGRDAQERSQAQEIAEGQLELLKSLANKPKATSDIFNAANPYFCIDSNRDLYPVTVSGASVTYPAQCVYSNLYKVFVERVNDAAQPNNTYFIVRTIWPSISAQAASQATIGGSAVTIANNEAQVAIIYRVHK